MSDYCAVVAVVVTKRKTVVDFRSCLEPPSGKMDGSIYSKTNCVNVVVVRIHYTMVVPVTCS